MCHVNLGLVALWLWAGSAAAQGFAPSREAAADSTSGAVDRYMRERGAPGMSVAVGAPGGKIFARGYGKSDLDHGVAVSAATLFRLQSGQKLLTATAVMRLAEQGVLRLDDPVQRHCPAFGIRPWPVTIRQLLSHQGGIRSSDLGDLFNTRHYSSVGAAIARFARDSLAYRPGAKVGYSNAGYTLLACVIEGATGTPYDSALARLVLQPAGAVGVRDDNVYRVIPGRARYYLVRTAANTEQWSGLWTDAHLAATRLDEPSVADPVDPSWAIGAGSYLGTPADLVRFVLALRAGRVLGGAYRDSVLAGVPLESTGEPTGRTLGGWVTDTAASGRFRILGSSWNGSFAVALDSTSGVVVAIASNIELDQPGDLVGRVLDLWRAAFRGEP
jgi:CubicO group peptidase (beta-lactamase class C family)